MLDACGACPPRQVFLLSEDRELLPVVFALQERLATPVEVTVLLPSRADRRNWLESYRETARRLRDLRVRESGEPRTPTVELLNEGMLASSLLPYHLADPDGAFACVPEWQLDSEYLDQHCMTPEWRPDPPSD